MNNNQTYDLVIIGAGPTAMTASIYASRYKLTNLVIGKTLGGEISLAHKVENYPGFISISGLDLAEKWKAHAESFGVKVLFKEVGKIEKRDDGFLVEIDQDEGYQAKAVIVATGSERKRLNISGEKEYMGKGVSYCHTCDAPFFKDRTVAIIGGADSAVSGGVHTAEHANKVYIIYRKGQLRSEPIWLEEWQKVEASGKGSTIYNTNIIEIQGDGTKITGVKLDKPHKESDILKTDGVFIEIGSVPGTSLVESLGVNLDETGHVIVDDFMNTNVPGLFCAGDMVNKSAKFKQATLAVGQGSLAAASAYQYIKKQSASPIRGI